MYNRQPRNTGEGKRKFFWIVCIDPESGKPFLVAGDFDESRARQKGLELLGGVNFELKPLPTTSLARASSMLKGNRLQETHNIHNAAQRIGHERSIARLRRRSGG